MPVAKQTLHNHRHICFRCHFARYVCSCCSRSKGRHTEKHVPSLLTFRTRICIFLTRTLMYLTLNFPWCCTIEGNERGQPNIFVIKFILKHFVTAHILLILLLSRAEDKKLGFPSFFLC
jgi:hypothetical protein